MIVLIWLLIKLDEKEMIRVMMMSMTTMMMVMAMTRFAVELDEKEMTGDSWSCGLCRKCAGCGSGSVVHVSEGEALCSKCCRARLRGSYCPVCKGCYQDNDYEQAMMECGVCGGWGNRIRFDFYTAPQFTLQVDPCQVWGTWWRGIPGSFSSSGLGWICLQVSPILSRYYRESKSHLFWRHPVVWLLSIQFYHGFLH